MTTMTEQQAAELRKPFAASAIGKLPKSTCRACAQSQRKRCDDHQWVSNCPECKGSHSSATVHLDFVGHAATTDRLLAVDPGWTWEPMALDDAGLPALDRGGNLWIRLTVCGTTRLGVGDGKSAKECIGDAIRNAAMRFGVALDLWSKDELEQVTTGAGKLLAALHSQPVGLGAALQTSGAEGGSRDVAVAVEPTSTSAPGSPTAGVTKAQLTKIAACMSDLGITQRKDALTYVNDLLPEGREISSRNELTKAEAHRLIEALEQDLAQPFPMATGEIVEGSS